MVADPSYGLQQELRPKTPRWGPWSTLGWMGLIALVFTLAQQISGGFFLLWWPTAFPDQPLNLAEAESHGPLLGVVTLVSCIAVVATTALAVRLSGQTLQYYLALRWPSWRSLWIGLALTALLVLTADFISVRAGHEAIPEFMTGIYTSSLAAGPGFFLLLGVALIVLAPLGEEVVFRGFFYRGLAAGVGPFAAILITAGSFAIMHAQYEPFFMGQIFAFGIFLGWMRWRSDSLILAMILHAVINAFALAQTVSVMGV